MPAKRDNSTAWGELKRLPRAVWYLAGATLINRMGAMVFPFLVLYFHRSLKLDLETATGIAALFGIGSGCAAPLGGWLADRYDAIKVLAWSMGAAGVLLLVFPFFITPPALMGGTFGIALLADLSRPSAMTALARLGGPAQSRDAFTLNYLAINLGMSVGPLMGGYLAQHDYRYLFWVDGASSLLSCLLLLASGATSPALRGDGPKPDWNIGRTGFLTILWTIVALWVFLSFFTATPVYLVTILHRPESWVGWLWLINTGIIVLTTVSISHATRGVPLPRQLSWSVLLFSVGYAILIPRPGLDGLILCMLLLTVGEMLLFTNVNSYLQKMVPEHKMGRAMALNSITFSVAISLANPTIGYFFSERTPKELWIVLVLAGMTAAWGFARLPWREKKLLQGEAE